MGGKTAWTELFSASLWKTVNCGAESLKEIKLPKKAGYGISRGVLPEPQPSWMLIMPTIEEGIQLKWIEFALLVAGAVVGAFLRYRMVEAPATIYGLPINVLAVNIIGSFILGLFSILSVGLNLDPQYTLLVAVGFCGSFTTMSSFALETTNLLEGNQFILLALNIIANVGLSLGAVIGGRVLGNVLVERFTG
jgi:CrcB protein